MPGPIVAFVRAVDAVNYRVGRVAMYLIFVMAAILLASTGSRLIFGVPINWALEMSQFLLSAYYSSRRRHNAPGGRPCADGPVL